MSYYSLQQALKNAGYYHGEVDNLWGIKSQRAFDAAMADAASWRALQTNQAKGFKLTEADYQQAARDFALEVAHLKALVEVESGGSGFQDVRQDILDLDGPGGFLDGLNMPKILFEAHIFSRRTSGKYDITHPTISSPKWNSTLYKGGQAEYIRLHQALLLDRTAALESTSWGLFQLMGFNFRLCGFENVESFVETMKQSELAQLKAGLTFIRKTGLLEHLRMLRWAAFAKGYNGVAYAAHEYDVKLANAYNRYKEKEL